MLTKVTITPAEPWYRWTPTHERTGRLPAGDYWWYTGYKPDDATKKRLGLMACEPGEGKGFRWLTPYEPWVKAVFDGHFVPEVSCYGHELMDLGFMGVSDQLLTNLRPWQRQFVVDAGRCLSQGYDYRRGAIVSLGGGKTLVGLLLAQLGDVSVALVPRHVHSTWRKEAEKWGLQCPILSTPESAHRITGPVDVLLIDEVLSMKSPDALRHQHALELSRKASVVVGFTGTPTGGKGPMDWRWLRVIRPGCVPGEETPWRFLFSTDTKLKKVRGEQSAYITPMESWDTELVAKFVSPFIYRVDLSDLLKHLPPVTYQRITVPQPKDYDIVRRGVATERGSSKRLAQARTVSDGFVIQDDGKPVWVNKDKLIAVENFVESLGEPVVIYAAWTESVRGLAERLKAYNPAVVEGQTTDVGCQLDRFKHGDTDVLILNSRYSTGIDGLQDRCRVLCYVSWSLNPVDRVQSIGRVMRHGQTTGVIVCDVVAEGTLDERTLELIDSHNDLSESMVSKLLQEHMDKERE